ncbi:MAG: hypothetical protein LC687_05380, partial [Actinobacteria bacterium]|nr:hypothetical protein [Actinomycetota bacterium]
MPISSQHPQYAGRISQWEQIRDFFNGEDAVKAKGQTYLPKLSGQSDHEYRAYKSRALFFSIIAKSVNAMVGLMTSNRPTFQGDEEVTDEIVNNHRMSFQEILNDTLFEMSLQARCGILIDRSPDDGPNDW